jgi:hypothetical protein
VNLYLIGSLRNPLIAEIANRIRQHGHSVYDDWWCVGPKADDYWKTYSQARGHSLKEALTGWAATHTYTNDKQHLDECDGAVLVLPAGKSGHLELGYIIGQGKKGYILLDGQNERWDVMLKFATAVCENMEELLEELARG